MANLSNIPMQYHALVNNSDPVQAPSFQKDGTGIGLDQVFGNFLNNVSGQTATNNFNAVEAQKNRDFQLNAMQNQYQWTVEDMKKAGINPASLASGASLNTMASGSAASSSGNGAQVLTAIIGALAKIAGKSTTIVNKYR